MIKALYKNINSTLITNIGIALALVGVPLGMYLNTIIPVVKWSPLIMLLSVGFILNYKNVFIRGKLPSFNKMFGYVLLFQLIMILYSIFSENLTFQLFSFHGYIIALIIALSSINANANFKNLILTTFYVSSFASILGFYYFTFGYVIWELRQSDSYVLENFTMASGAITNFICLLFLFEEKSKLKILFWLFIAIDISVILLSTKRTPIFVAFIVFILYLYKMRTINKEILKQYIKLFTLLIVVFVAIYLKVELVKFIVDRFVSDFYNGVLNILGSNEVSDISGSAIMRYESRMFAYDYINNNFNFFNYIFGAGYMTRWIDNPILQSYLDMGIIGVFFYLSLVVIYPIKSYFKCSYNLALFAMLFCVYNILSSYSSGHPYMYIKYVPIVLLAFMLNLKNNKGYKN